MRKIKVKKLSNLNALIDHIYNVGKEALTQIKKNKTNKTLIHKP